jgi:hypothetical protein
VGEINNIGGEILTDSYKLIYKGIKQIILVYLRGTA